MHNVQKVNPNKDTRTSQGWSVTSTAVVAMASKVSKHANRAAITTRNAWCLKWTSHPKLNLLPIAALSTAIPHPHALRGATMAWNATTRAPSTGHLGSNLSLQSLMNWWRRVRAYLITRRKAVTSRIRNAQTAARKLGASTSPDQLPSEKMPTRTAGPRLLAILPEPAMKQSTPKRHNSTNHHYCLMSLRTAPLPWCLRCLVHFPSFSASPSSWRTKKKTTSALKWMRKKFRRRWTVWCCNDINLQQKKKRKKKKRTRRGTKIRLSTRRIRAFPMWNVYQIKLFFFNFWLSVF